MHEEMLSADSVFSCELPDLSCTLTSICPKDPLHLYYNTLHNNTSNTGYCSTIITSSSPGSTPHQHPHTQRQTLYSKWPTAMPYQ